MIARERLAFVLLLSSFAFAAFADDAKREDGKPDKANLRGHWKLISTEGIRMYEHYRLIFDEDSLTITNKDGRPTGMYALGGKYRLDQSKSPRQIDFLDPRADGIGRDPRAKGIYSLDGETLKICVCYRYRPREFKAIKDPRRGQNHTVVYVLKRERRE